MLIFGWIVVGWVACCCTRLVCLRSFFPRITRRRLCCRSRLWCRGNFGSSCTLRSRCCGLVVRLRSLFPRIGLLYFWLIVCHLCIVLLAAYFCTCAFVIVQPSSSANCIASDL